MEEERGDKMKIKKELKITALVLLHIILIIAVYLANIYGLFVLVGVYLLANVFFVFVNSYDIMDLPTSVYIMYFLLGLNIYAIHFFIVFVTNYFINRSRKKKNKDKMPYAKYIYIGILIINLLIIFYCMYEMGNIKKDETEFF